MEDVQRKLSVDKLVIICGIMGLLVDIIAFVLVVIGKIPFEIDYVVFVVVAVFMIAYGIRLLKHDKERYNQR